MVKLNVFNSPQNNRVAYITLQNSKEGTAGYAHVNEIIKGLKKRGWRIDLYETIYKEKNTPPKLLERLFEFIRIQTRFLVHHNRIDAAYLRSHFALFPTTLFLKLANIPIIQEINGPYEDLFIAWPFARKLRWVFKWLWKTQYKMADAGIAVTPNLGDWFIQESGSKSVFIIPNGANTDLFHPEARSSMDLPKQYVLFFGALAEWQGIDTMLAAVTRKSWPSELKLVIAGDGKERHKIESFCKRKKKVVYLGEIPYANVPGLIAQSLMGLNPKSAVAAHSKTGLFPLKLFETLACGVPIIVSDFPGQADLVEAHQCGLVVKPNDPEALAHAVSYLFHHPEKRKRMGNSGFKAIQKEHSWDKRAADTDRAIRQVVNAKRNKNS